MDEQLCNTLLTLIDEYISFNETGDAVLDKEQLFQAVKQKHPELQLQDLETNLKLIDLDLPSEWLANLVSEPSDSLIRDERLAQYQIIELLAQGGMGEVYLAKRADGQFDKQVALKILSKGLITDETLKRFQRERQILADLKHPNIVPIIDAGVTENNRPWFVLEYISGQKIDEYCHLHALSSPAIVKLFLQVCAAVSHAHQHQVIHRDLKPANILVEMNANEPLAMVLDFGIASHTEDQAMTGTGQIIGTPGYMSPEQTAGDLKNTDVRSDVFALGVILFQLISKHHPFKADSATETNYNVMKKEPQMSSADAISSDLVAICFKCLQKFPNDRYQNVEDLIADCQRFLNGDPVQAQKITTVQKAVMKIKKHPLISMLSSLLVVVLIGAFGLLLYQKIQAEDRQLNLQKYLVTSKEMEQKLREQQMLPLHDISPVYDAIYKQIKELKTQLSNSPPSDQGYILATIGNSYLLLGQPKPAIEAFNQAQHNQFDNADMQLQLSLAMAQTWEHESIKLLQISTPENRIQHRNFIEKTYLKPAQEKLKHHLQTNSQSTYLKAYLAFLNHDFENAIHLAKQTTEENPGAFEAYRLAGKSAYIMGKELAIDGQSQKALEAYQKASGFLDLAILIGRSDPLSHQIYCELLTDRLHAISISDVAINRNQIINAESICLKADSILPDQFPVTLKMAEVYSHLIALNLGHDQFDANDAEKFLNLAQKALEMAPENTEALSQMVIALIRISSTQNKELSQAQKNDYLLQAQKHAETSVRINDQDAYNWANLADIHNTIANRNIENFDITPHVNAGIEAYQKSHELLPSYAWLYNIAYMYQVLGDYHSNKNEFKPASNAYQNAINYYQQTVNDAKDFSRAWLDLTETHHHYIKAKLQLGGSVVEAIYNGSQALAKTCDLYQKDKGLTPKLKTIIEQYSTMEAFLLPESCRLW